MDKTEEVENVAQSLTVASVYPQKTVSKPKIKILSTHGGQFTAQVRGWKPSLKPAVSTEATVRDNGMDGRDRTKTVIGAGSQRTTVHPDVKFATPKP